MPTWKYMCNQCKDLFEIAESHSPDKTKEAQCPECGSTNIERLHVCGLDIFIDESGPPPWEYVCYRCKSYFQLPVPRGPDEEKEIKCPECESRDIERLNVCTLESIDHPCG